MDTTFTVGDLITQVTARIMSLLAACLLIVFVSNSYLAISDVLTYIFTIERMK